MYPYLSTQCPCYENGDGLSFEPCQFSSCINSSTVDLTLSNFSTFGWKSKSVCVTSGGETSYTQELMNIDGSYTLKRYDSENATELDTYIYNRILSLRKTTGGCHVFIGMPDTLTFHTTYENPDASSSTTPQYTTIAMFPVMGYIFGGDLYDSYGLVNELVVQLGKIIISEAREPFPYSTMSVLEYLDLRTQLQSTAVADLPAWAARRAESIQLRINIPLPVKSWAGTDVFSKYGIPGGYATLDGAYANAFTFKATYAELLDDFSGPLIYSTCYDFGTADAPTDRPTELYDIFLNGAWYTSNPQEDDESDEEYLERYTTARAEFLELYKERNDEIAAWLESYYEWYNNNNFSFQDWQSDISRDENSNIVGTFFGNISDGCDPKSGDKPELYPKSATFSLTLNGCSNLGELTESTTLSEGSSSTTITSPTPWKLNKIPVYGNQYGGNYPSDFDDAEIEPNIVPPDTPPITEAPDPDDDDEPDSEDNSGKWYLTYTNYWHIGVRDHYIYDDFMLLTFDYSELLYTTCWKTTYSAMCNCSATDAPFGVSASKCRLWEESSTSTNPTYGALLFEDELPKFFDDEDTALTYASHQFLSEETTQYIDSTTLEAVEVSTMEVMELYCEEYAIASQATIYGQFVGDDLNNIMIRYCLANCVYDTCEQECV